MPRRSKFFRYDESTGQVVECNQSRTVGRPRYPLPCEALAVHPSQIGEARDFDRQNGVATEYRGDGTPIMNDFRHYKKYRRLHGVHDRRSFDR